MLAIPSFSNTEPQIYNKITKQYKSIVKQPVSHSLIKQNYLQGRSSIPQTHIIQALQSKTKKKFKSD